MARIRIRIQWRIRVRLVRHSPLVGAAVVFVGLMIALQPSASSARHDSRAGSTQAASETGSFRPVRPSVHRLPPRKSSHSTGSATCRISTTGTPEIDVQATNTGSAVTSLRILVNFRDADGQLISNDVAIFRHLPAQRTGQTTLPSPGGRLSTCEVAAVSHF